MVQTPFIEAPPVPAGRTVGRDAGPAGRVFRVVAGTAGVVPVAAKLIGAGTGAVVAGLAWMVAIAVLYVAVLAALRPWLAGRRTGALTGFVGSALLLLPLVAYPLGLLPAGPMAGLLLYTDLSVVLCGLIGYGGLEQAALPALVLRYRPLLYSQFSLVDLVEQRPSTPRLRPLALTAAVLGIAGFAWFWPVPSIVTASGPFAGARPLVAALDPLFAALVVVAGLLLLVAARLGAAGRLGWLPGAAVVLFGLGAFVGAMPDAIYVVILLAGAAIGITRLARWTLRR